MKRFILSMAMLCFCLCISAQNYDVNMDGKVNILDITTLVNGVVHDKQGEQYYSRKQVDSLLNDVYNKLTFLDFLKNERYKDYPKTYGLSIRGNVYDSCDDLEIDKILVPLKGSYNINAKTLIKAKLKYISENTNIATINEEGVVNGVGRGYTNIKVMTDEEPIYENGVLLYKPDTLIVTCAVHSDKSGSLYGYRYAPLNFFSGTMWNVDELDAEREWKHGTSMTFDEAKEKIHSISNGIWRLPTKEEALELFNKILYHGGHIKDGCICVGDVYFPLEIDEHDNYIGRFSFFLDDGQLFTVTSYTDNIYYDNTWCRISEPEPNLKSYIRMVFTDY